MGLVSQGLPLVILIPTGQAPALAEHLDPAGVSRLENLFKMRRSQVSLSVRPWTLKTIKIDFHLVKSPERLRLFLAIENISNKSLHSRHGKEVDLLKSLS